MNKLETIEKQIDHIDRELLRITRYSDRISRAIKSTVRSRIAISNLVKELKRGN